MLTMLCIVKSILVVFFFLSFKLAEKIVSLGCIINDYKLLISMSVFLHNKPLINKTRKQVNEQNEKKKKDTAKYKSS